MEKFCLSTRCSNENVALCSDPVFAVCWGYLVGFEEFCLDCIGFLLSLACYGLKVLVFSVFRVFSFLNACQFFKWLFGLDWDMDGPPNSEIFQDVFLLPVCRMCWIWMGYCIDSPTVFFSFICFLRFCFAFIFWDLDFSRCHVSGFFAVFWWCQDKFR